MKRRAVVAGDALSAQADVVLLGLLAVEGDALSGRPGPGPAPRRAVARAVAEPPFCASCSISPCSRFPARRPRSTRHVAGVVVRGHLVPRQSADHVAATDHRPARGCWPKIASDRSRAPCPEARPRTWRSLPAPPRARTPGRVGGAQQHVAHHLERTLEVLVQEVSVEDRRLFARRRVHLGPEAVELLGDLLGRQLRRPLEQHVLQESEIPARSRTRRATRPAPKADRHRAHGRHALGDDRMPVELGEGVWLSKEHQRLAALVPVTGAVAVTRRSRSRPPRSRPPRRGRRGHGAGRRSRSRSSTAPQESCRRSPGRRPAAARCARAPC